MPEDRLKFRCYRCNQLMGVSARKVGSIVSCPRCKAELKVPGPEERPGEGGADEGRPGPAAVPRARDEGARPLRGADSPLPSFMEEIAAAIPDDLATLRPEDIRVEAEFVDLVVTTPEPTVPIVPPAEESAPERGPIEPIPSSPRPEPPVPTPVEPALTVSKVEPIVPAGVQAADAGPGISLPPINIEPPRILPPGREIRSVREVVLQPATVLAWSLLVLMALPMAFVAGLLIGHFIWK